MPNKKIAIIGASYLQKPLVEKANHLGFETHVFAWKEGNVVKNICHEYYPISVLEKELILEKCKKVNIDGIISIASDIAMPTVNYIANKMDLVGNTLESTLITTDKFEMRKALSKNNISCPNFKLFNGPNFYEQQGLNFPVIVKPSDRSGSRGVTKVLSPEHTNQAIKTALTASFNKRVIVEEFIEGKEFSVESISYRGKHQPLVVTEKKTSDYPHYVELEHHQPAALSKEIENKIFRQTIAALEALEIKNGASHTEIFLTSNSEIKIIEVAARMGGDFIGSNLVYLCTGYDYLKQVINISMGSKPSIYIENHNKSHSGVHFYTKGREWVKKIIDENPSYIIDSQILGSKDPDELYNSADRGGYFIYKSNSKISF